MATADGIIAQNKEEYGHDKEAIPHENPLLAKYYYVDSGGKKRTRKQTEEKELEGEAAIKKSKDLADTGLFSDAMGSTDNPHDVKSESSELDLVRKAEEALRPGAS